VWFPTVTTLEAIEQLSKVGATICARAHSEDTIIRRTRIRSPISSTRLRSYSDPGMLRLRSCLISTSHPNGAVPDRSPRSGILAGQA